MSQIPAFPYGAVYFRKSNPPREDWARDYGVAAEDGHNTFRHWFLWSAIETAPGVFDWEEYDRQLDLAAENGISTVIAEFVTAAPEWAWRTLSHARFEDRDGKKAHSTYSHSCAVGGFPGLCLDNDDARKHAERFLRALVERYRSHPGLGGYDIWNECNIPAAYCYCPATAEKFHEWLQQKYGEVKALAQAWRRYSIATWEDAEPPRSLAPYPDVLDWLQFRIDNAYRLMRWRADVIRSLDSEHPVTAHGVAMSLSRMADGACHEWRAASEVASYGFTWVASRQGNQPWKQWHAVDLVRAGSGGKPFWHAEAQAGPLWMQPQVVGREREDGRISEPEDIRLWNMISFAGGATGLLYPRWRPLLDGPLFGAFGGYAMDGSRTPRSEMMSAVARWASSSEQADLWAARPVKGEVGIVVVPEAQLFCYAQQGSTDFFAQSLRGAYQGFFENNIQADWVLPEQIDEYRTLYLPYPAMLPAAVAERLRAWVEAGGTLISEGCPAYFGDNGRVGTIQPNHGLDALFGAREAHVEFTPDILRDLKVEIDGRQVPGGIFLQTYALTTGTVAGRYAGGAGRYADGEVAVVDHEYGRGRTRLIGTFPGYGHFHRPSTDSRGFFFDLAEWARVAPHVQVWESSSGLTADGVVARLHRGDDATFLWVLNHDREPASVSVEVGERWGPFREARVRWGDGTAALDGQQVTAQVGGRDATIVELR
jgi:beta-galactosidase